MLYTYMRYAYMESSVDSRLPTVRVLLNVH